MAKNSTLTKKEATHFYELFMPLLAYMDMAKPLKADNGKDYLRRANKLWADPSQIDDFIDAVDHKKISIQLTLTNEDREILRSWKRKRRGMFILARHDPDGSLFVDTNLSPEGTFQYYRVKGMLSTLESQVPNVPCFVEATILPWKKVLVTDGLIQTHRLPGKDKGDLVKTRDFALTNGTLITTF